MMNGRKEYVKMRANLETIELSVDSALDFIDENSGYDIKKEELMAFMMKIQYEGNDPEAIFEALQQAYYFGFDAGRRSAEKQE